MQKSLRMNYPMLNLVVAVVATFIFGSGGECMGQKESVQFVPPTVLGIQPPVVDTEPQFDEYLGRLVTIRGRISSKKKQPTILGVQISARRDFDGKDGHASGILIKWKHTFTLGNPVDEELAQGQNSTGFDGKNATTVTQYFLYENLNGKLSSAMLIEDSGPSAGEKRDKENKEGNKK